MQLSFVVAKLFRCAGAVRQLARVWNDPQCMAEDSALRIWEVEGNDL